MDSAFNIGSIIAELISWERAEPARTDSSSLLGRAGGDGRDVVGECDQAVLTSTPASGRSVGSSSSSCWSTPTRPSARKLKSRRARNQRRSTIHGKSLTSSPGGMLRLPPYSFVTSPSGEEASPSPCMSPFFLSPGSSVASETPPVTPLTLTPSMGFAGEDGEKVVSLPPPLLLSPTSSIRSTPTQSYHHVEISPRLSWDDENGNENEAQNVNKLEETLSTQKRDRDTSSPLVHEQSEETATLATGRSGPPANPGGENSKNFQSLDSFIMFHDLVDKKLELSEGRHQRNFQRIQTELTEEELEQLPKGSKNMRQKVKQVYGERRQKSQLDMFKSLQIHVKEGNRDKLFSKLRCWMGENEVYENIEYGFEDSFINTLVEYFLTLQDEAQMKNLLDWPPEVREVVLNKLVFLHRNVFGNLFHRIHSRHFGSLFSVGEVSMGILSQCRCAQCLVDWYLFDEPVIGTKDFETSRFRYHWNKIMAMRFKELLEYHRNCTDINQLLTKLRNRSDFYISWTPEDVQYLLDMAHRTKTCHVCTRTPRRRPPQHPRMPRRFHSS